MSSKSYIETGMQKDKVNKRKLYLILFCFCLIFFIIPLLLFPAYPKNHWQYSIYEYITRTLFITVGIKGTLPFFTILSSIYITVFSFLFGCYICLIYIRKYGLKKEFQQKFYSKFFQAEFSSSHKYPWLEKPFIKKTLVSAIYLSCFAMGVIHFFYDDISFKSSSSRGALISLSYNYKVGVLFWELMFTMFSVFPIFYLVFLLLYLFNYFVLGLGSGKVIPPQKKPKWKKSRKK